MKRFFKIFVYSILVVFILMQFYPRPEKNSNPIVNSKNIKLLHGLPAEVEKVLKASCYDCHSNQTVYPWYARIQPIASWLGDHIIEGKKELNFSEFGTYSIRKQYRKLEEIDTEVLENYMPLSSYTLIHRNSELNEKQKKIVANWSALLRDRIKANYPPDSLEENKK